MAVIQTIGIGTIANDNTGDPIRTAFTKVNANFATVSKSVISDLTGGSTGGTSALTLLKGEAIPANNFSASDFIKIDAFFQKIGVVNTATFSIWINTSNTLTGAVQIATNSIASTTLACPMSRTFYLTTSTLQGFPFATASATGTEFSTSAYSSTACTTTAIFYILFAGQMTTTGDAIYVKSVRITN